MDALTSFLTDHATINFIRFEFVDFTGILRTRVVTKTHSLHLCSANQYIELGPAVLSFTYFPRKKTSAKSGVCRLIPDWTSLRPCMYRASYASVMCFIDEDANQMGRKRCPRTILKRCLRDASNKHRVKFLVGFEIEMVFLDASKVPPSPIDNAVGRSSSAGLRNKYLPVLEEIVLVLEASSIVVHQFHTENRKGLFEIVTGPLEPLQAIDALIYSQEAIRTICTGHGIIATMLPKPSSRMDFVGTHFHFSIYPSDMAASFIAGMLERLRSICVFTMASIDSYARVRDFEGTCGSWVTWGTEIRDVPIRKISPAHWEFRPIDVTANMYLALAAVLGAGLLGIEEQQELRWKDCRASAGAMDEEKRAELAIDAQLPTCMNEALNALGQGFALEAVLGRDLLNEYTNRKREEESFMSKITEDERRALALPFF